MDNRRVRRPFKLDRLLKPEDRAEYEALLADPRTTGDEAVAWIAARGYLISPASVHRHRRHALRELDEVRHWAAVARHLAAAARAQGGGPGVLADGTLTQFEHMLLRALHAMNAPGTTPDARQFADLATAISGSIASREALDEHRRAHDDRARAAAACNTPQADKRAVVDRVRDILGV